MPLECLNSIVTLGLCPDDGIPTSGLSLMNAPGMSLRNLADIATEQYTTGIDMVMAKKSLAIIQVRNDFVGALQSNNIVATISHPVYDTSRFLVNINQGLYLGFRGIQLHKAPFRGGLRKTYIEAIELYPLSDGDTTLHLEDTGTGITLSYPITVEGGHLNTFDESNLEGFPYIVQGSCVKITVDQTNIAFASAEVFCLKGCNGAIPNDCAWAEGWDGTRKVKAEGYGVNVKFKCKCEYDQILCDLSSTFSGELIWLKWTLGVLEEQYRSNRFDNLVIYNREDLEKNIIPDVRNQYNTLWNRLMDGVLGVLNTYKDECLNCRKPRLMTSI